MPLHYIAWNFDEFVYGVCLHHLVLPLGKRTLEAKVANFQPTNQPAVLISLISAATSTRFYLLGWGSGDKICKNSKNAAKTKIIFAKCVKFGSSAQKPFIKNLP